MWYKSQSGAKPKTVDNDSSRVYVYVRKNIIEKTMEDGSTFFEYDEIKVPKEIFDIFLSQAESDERLSEIENVIAEIIGGDI